MTHYGVIGTSLLWNIIIKPDKARLAAKLMRNEPLAEVTKLIAYLDVAGEHGDATEANALYGEPVITLDEWFKMPKDSLTGWPH